MNLTAKTVAALTLPASKSEVIYFDDDIHGFGLRLRAGGGASWIFQYRIGAKQRRMSLGLFPAVLAPRAREIAGELHAKVRLGQDPGAAKAEERVRAAETLGATLDAYLDYQRTHLKPSSMVEVERHLRKHCRPLHGLRLDKIERRAVAARITAIAANSGAVASNRVAASLRAFFNWAIKEGLASHNPAAGLNRRPERSRKRVLNDGELRAIWAATADASDYSAVVRLLMLSGQRAAEIAGLRDSEIAGDRIVLPGERTKNGRQHVVPVTAAMRAILDARPRRPGRDLIFGRRWNSPFCGFGALKLALDARLGATLPHWTHHDLRRTTATHLGELGIPPHVVSAILNHVSDFRGGVHGVYDHSNLEQQKRHALTAWNEWLLARVEGREGATTVIPLRA